LGDEQAAGLGINVHQLKFGLFLMASILTAVVVSTVGIIGFIGLVIPHIVKFLTGESFRQAMPLTLVGGAGFLILADLLSRIIIPNTILPVGILTALCGVPFFILVYKRL
jgi:iron complex transport system permease protein